MPSMMPGQHMIACVRHKKFKEDCESCKVGESQLPTICQNHLALIICIGNEAKSVQAFDRSMTQLGKDVYGTTSRRTLKNLPLEASRVNKVSYVCTLGEDALVPARGEGIKMAIQGLLSLTRNIFASREG